MIGKKRVYELAKEFGLRSKELLQILWDADMDVANHMSLVYEDEARSAARKAMDSPAPKRPGMVIVRKNRNHEPSC